ncbi:hypothetical protein T492DRAFT_845721 [Pavlovales sp. CCMP2436]|nr:hypothetical protein T492DRAFT_845721 [Pavlovales sp. CCMP2436]
MSWRGSARLPAIDGLRALSAELLIVIYSPLSASSLAAAPPDCPLPSAPQKKNRLCSFARARWAESLVVSVGALVSRAGLLVLPGVECGKAHLQEKLQVFESSRARVAIGGVGVGVVATAIVTLFSLSLTLFFPPPPRPPHHPSLFVPQCSGDL